MSIDSEKIRILSVDDHPLLRAGVVALIETQPDMTMVGEAASGREAIEMFRAIRPKHHLDGFANAGYERHQMPLSPSAANSRMRASSS